MSGFFAPEVFWITLICVVMTLTISTLIGRAWSLLFPHCLTEAAQFYLAPALGFSTLLILASLIGRTVSLGDSIFVPTLTISLLIGALALEAHIGKALRHIAAVNILGLICGVSILVPLFIFGAINTHNDTFTYLAHANWLQHNAFGDTIPTTDVTPFTSQIAIYQQQGYRMGASFLLAFTQALLNLRWSYEVYPAVIVSSIATCCLAIGFPLAGRLRPMRFHIRLALLCLPALTLGGLVFGANLGFLPQTVGLSSGIALLSASGPLLQWVSSNNQSWWKILKAGLPTGFLLAAAGLAYSELLPFLLVAVIGSASLLMLRSRFKVKVLGYAGLLTGLAVLLLNKELIRTYSALQTQSSAVVGTSVDWTLLGYVAHALGVHGGAWDVFQWSLPGNFGSYMFIIGVSLITAISIAMLTGKKVIWHDTVSGAFMPTAIILILFTAGFVYFRYFVISPFPKGFGQSWSQFKLADWAHPFAAAFILLSIIQIRVRFDKHFNTAVCLLFSIGLVSTAIIGAARITPLVQYYGGTRDLSHFYQELRQTVLSTCPPSARIYLDLNGHYHKFRQMVVYYLSDREVASDWMDDHYIFPQLSPDHRTQPLKTGDCVVEPNNNNGLLSQSIPIGQFRVGVFDGQGKIQISAEDGAYGIETDGKNWWSWVENKIHYKLQPILVTSEASHTIVHFEYITRSDQMLTVHLRTSDGASRQYELHSKENSIAIFEKKIDLPPSKLIDLSIETDGKASPLGDNDVRLAAWKIQNTRITLAPQQGTSR